MPARCSRRRRAAGRSNAARCPRREEARRRAPAGLAHTDRPRPRGGTPRPARTTAPSSRATSGGPRSARSPDRRLRRRHARVRDSMQAVKVWPPEWRADAPAPDGGARHPAAGISSTGRRQSGRREMDASQKCANGGYEAMETQPPRGLRFSPFRLDPDNALLWRGSTEIHLTPKAFAVLHCLVERHGQLVTRDVLLERVWPGTVVGDASAQGLRSGDPEGSSAMRSAHPASWPRCTGGGTGSSPTSPTSTRDRRGGEASGRVGARRRRLGSRASYRGPAHFVGRGPLWSQLRTGLDAAWRGVRQIVFVTGEPGIGKTGVVEAFLRARRLRPAASGSREASASRRTGLRSHIRRCSMPSAGSAARLGATGWSPSYGGMRPPGWCRCHGSSSPTDRDALHRELLGATHERMLRGDRRSARGADCGSAAGHGPRGPALE